jgi:hypothetical protein
LQSDHIDRSDLTTECTPTPDHVSLLTIEDKELPYSRLVSLTTPSLHLELGTLSLTFDFLQVLSGCISIAQIEDNTALSRGYHIIDVENIPTTAELKMVCAHDSNELIFQLRTAQRGLVCISTLKSMICKQLRKFSFFLLQQLPSMMLIISSDALASSTSSSVSFSNSSSKKVIPSLDVSESPQNRCSGSGGP